MISRTIREIALSEGGITLLLVFPSVVLFFLSGGVEPF